MHNGEGEGQLKALILSPELRPRIEGVLHQWDEVRDVNVGQCSFTVEKVGSQTCINVTVPGDSKPYSLWITDEGKFGDKKPVDAHIVKQLRMLAV